MFKYQLGTANVSGKERVVLYCQETYLDLCTVLSNLQMKQALSPHHSDGSLSLMDMTREWQYWREKLPLILQHWFGLDEHSQSQGQLSAAAIRWLPPLMYPNKLICLGANYSDHNAEMENTKPPKFPYCFLKPPTTTLVGSGETVSLPGYAQMIDWEVELAVIIGRKARHVRAEEALASIAGYSVFNDISARDWVPEEERSYFGLDWIMLKSFDGSAPMGPFVTPAEFVPNPQALTLSLAVNGQTKQHSNTASMVFSVQRIIEHLSTVMTLEPGDVIATGTPSGVGYGRKPPEFLKSGDHMVAEIEGLGRLETYVE